MSVYTARRTTGQPNPDLESFINRAKQYRVEDTAKRLGSQLSGYGSNLHGRCPACGLWLGNDRFEVHTGKQAWHCRKCAPGGKGGYGSISLVMHVQNCSFLQAVEFLTGQPLPNSQSVSIQNYLRWRQRLAQQRVEQLSVLPTRAPKPQHDSVIVEVYSYKDEQGKTLYQTQRIEYRHRDGSRVLGDNGKPVKNFRVRHRAYDEGDDVWYWEHGLGATRRVPYKLPQLIKAINNKRTIYFLEGERKADVLDELGLPATCVAFGATGGWHERYHYAEFFHDAKLIILPDNDEPGLKFASTVASSLQGIAASVEVVKLPGLGPKEDVVDWIEKELQS